MRRDADRITRRPRRSLTSEERVLWATVTRQISPLHGAQTSNEDAPAEDAVASDPTPAVPSPPASKAATPRGKAAVPAPASLDRRFRQRIARGSAQIDGRIDLHGLTQAQAHDALADFLRTASARGARIVLVITGKGGTSRNGDHGVLRRQVPHWLGSRALREHVVGFAPAHIGHGGDGALYVRVRRGKP
jgi:DNA-nicking Smr family endonuclease